MMMRRVPPRIVGGLILGLTFVSGIVAGAAGRQVWGRADTRMTVTTDMTAVLDRLDLTSEQRVKASSILHESAPRTEAVMLELAGRMLTVSDSIDSELRTILTPEQRAKLSALRRRPVFVLKRRAPSGEVLVDTVGSGRRRSGGEPKP